MKIKLARLQARFYTIFIIAAISLHANAQSTGDFKSVASGNWTSLSSWQYYNGTSWVTPSGTNPQGYPSQFIGTKMVTINAGHTLTFLDTYVTTPFSNLLINGTLVLNGSGSAPIFNIKTSSIVVTPNLTPVATINFTTKGNLLLPVNATIQTGLLGLSGSCTANQKITIGTTTLATCAGAGQVVLLFDQFMSSGGTLNAQPTANASVCATNTINLNGTFIGTPGTGLTYTWIITNPSAAISTFANQNISIPNVIVGTYSAKLKVATTYSGTAFSNEETIQVVVNPNPIVVLSPNSSICANSIKSVNASGATSFNWSSSVPGTLFTNSLATIPYTGTNLSTIFVKSPTTVTVTANGTTLGCTVSNNTILTVNTPATWNGTVWSNEPSSLRDLVFNASFSSTENLLGCSCVVNSGNVIVNPTHNMIIENGVTVTGGTLTFENNSNLLQSENTTNSGNITIKRNSSGLMRLDYTLWSSPVIGQGIVSFSPSTLGNRFYEFNTIANIYAVTATNSNFSTGKGYLIRMPNNHPTNPTIFNGVFTGVPVNGSVSKSIIDGGTAISRFNAIGNPYPSSLKMDDFIAANTANIEGTLWFWRKTNDDTNPVSYSTCTTAGCTINNNHSYSDANFISVGQGFLVQAKTGASNVIFSNSMRTSNTTNQFFRVSTINANRYWLELKNTTSKSFGQNLIAYLPDSTLDYDNGKDGIRFDDSPIAIYTKINSIEMTIQARSTFDMTDNFPLVFKTNIASNYTISLKQFEGVFNNGQDIFIKDIQTNTIHNLKLSPYTFSSSVGVYENRFQIIYQPFLLNMTNNSSINEKITIYQNEEFVSINSNKNKIQSIKVFDIFGRELYKKLNINAIEHKFNYKKSNQILVVQTITVDNKIYQEKIIY